MPRIETIEQRTTPGGGLGAGPNARAQEVYNPGRDLATFGQGLGQLAAGMQEREDRKKADEEKALGEAARYEGPVAAARAEAEINEYQRALDEAGDYTDPADRTKKITEHANSVFARVQTEAANNKFTQNYLKGHVGVVAVKASEIAIGYEAASNVFNRQKKAVEGMDQIIANIAASPEDFDRHVEMGSQAAISMSNDPAKKADFLTQWKQRASQAYIATRLSTPQGAQSVIDSVNSYFGKANAGNKMPEESAASLLLTLHSQIGGEEAWSTEANNKFMKLAMEGKPYNAALSNGKVTITEAAGGADLHPAYSVYKDPADLLKLRGQAEAVLNKADNENNDAKRAAALVAGQSIKNSMAGVQAADPSVSQAPYTDYLAYHGNETAAAIAYKEDSLKVAAMGKVQAMYGMDAAGREAYVASLKPAAGQVENRAVAESIYQSAQEANVEISAAIAKQPGDYVAAKNKQVQAAQAAFSEEPSLDNLNTFVAVAMDAQDKLGVQKKTLPTGIVDSIATNFTQSMQNQEQGQAAGAIEYLKGVNTVLKDSPAAISQLIAKTGPEGLLAINGADIETVQLYQQAKAVPLATHEKNNEKLADKVMTVMGGINKTWRAQGALKTQESYSKAIELIAHARMARGEDADTAVKNAYAQAIGNQHEVWGSVRLPREGAQEVKDGLDYVRQATLQPENLFAPPSGNAEVDKLYRETLHRTIKRNGYWINDLSGDGAYLMINNGEQVLDASGKPVYARFDSARRRAADYYQSQKQRRADYNPTFDGGNK